MSGNGLVADVKRATGLELGENIIKEVGVGLTKLSGGVKKQLIKDTVSGAAGLVTPGTKKKGAEAIETPGAPPTLDDAKKKVEPLGPKTYGRSGTVKNIGGKKGLASSTLNLSSQTLTGT